MSEALVSVKNISKTFSANKGMFGKKKFVHAVNDVSFDIMPGETFSLVGESGSVILMNFPADSVSVSVLPERLLCSRN